MFWTRITKVFLWIQVGIGVIASIVAAIATRSILGIFTFILGLVVTCAMCCLLGTFDEIAESVTKLSNQLVGQTASEKALERKLDSIEIGMERIMNTAKKQSTVAVKKTAEKIAGSVPDDELNKTVVLPREVIMEKVNGNQNVAAGKSSMQGVNKVSPVTNTCICPNCGTKNDLDSAFCYMCGTKF